MKASEWAASQIQNLSEREPIVWIENPYGFLPAMRRNTGGGLWSWRAPAAAPASYGKD
jgi:hypothetical protein